MGKLVYDNIRNRVFVIYNLGVVAKNCRHGVTMSFISRMDEGMVKRQNGAPDGQGTFAGDAGSDLVDYNDTGEVDNQHRWASLTQNLTS